MAILLTDQEIDDLLREPKPLPGDHARRTQLKEKGGHREQQLDLAGSNGNEFRLILRQNTSDVLDFSVILGYMVPGSNRLFRLRRHNGRHQHRNALEGTRFFAFHIHQATERYQASGLREDAFAEQTNAYADFHGALARMYADAGFVVPQNPQGTLFEGGS